MTIYRLLLIAITIFSCTKHAVDANNLRSSQELHDSYHNVKVASIFKNANQEYEFVELLSVALSLAEEDIDDSFNYLFENAENFTVPMKIHVISEHYGDVIKGKVDPNSEILRTMSKTLFDKMMLGYGKMMSEDSGMNPEQQLMLDKYFAPLKNTSQYQDKGPPSRNDFSEFLKQLHDNIQDDGLSHNPDSSDSSTAHVTTFNELLSGLNESMIESVVHPRKGTLAESPEYTKEQNLRLKLLEKVGDN